MKEKKHSLVHLIIEILLILVALAIFVWVVFLVLDFKEIIDRDNQRIVILEEVQQALEEFYQDHNYYPGPASNWGGLSRNPKMQFYYNFNEFRDPCQPFDAVGIEGGVSCGRSLVAYTYSGIDCNNGCMGYKITLMLEAGGERDFFSKSISDAIK